MACKDGEGGGGGGGGGGQCCGLGLGGELLGRPIIIINNNTN